jgi:hypothetical protein
MSLLSSRNLLFFLAGIAVSFFGFSIAIYFTVSFVETTSFIHLLKQVILVVRTFISLLSIGEPVDTSFIEGLQSDLILLETEFLPLLDQSLITWNF